MFFKKTIWKSASGQMLSFDAMDNERLANVMKHIDVYDHSFGGIFAYLEANAIAKKRGLSQDFLDKAPYPYKDLNSGEWKIWSFVKRRDVLVKAE